MSSIPERSTARPAASWETRCHPAPPAPITRWDRTSRSALWLAVVAGAAACSTAAAGTVDALGLTVQVAAGRGVLVWDNSVSRSLEQVGLLHSLSYAMERSRDLGTWIPVAGVRPMAGQVTLSWDFPLAGSAGFFRIRRQIDLSGAELPRANLAAMDLRGADLRGANLTRARLPHANLAGADLSEAVLVGTDLERANLRGANLDRADLALANLNAADLTEARLEHANLAETRLSNANLTRVDLAGARWGTLSFYPGVILSETVLPNANVATDSPATRLRTQLFLSGAEGLDLRFLNMAGVDLRAVELQGADLSQAVFDNGDLSHADLSGANLSSASLRNTRLIDTRFETANLSAADLTGADLTYASLRGALIPSAEMMGSVILFQTMMPDGLVVPGP
ncbi:MAG: pentapeptide repeat-containing protein [Verrucomicrobiales bacterium]|nr:pentapeptide repeat-containing protein [Verrucomicrobiales bacterium]